MRGQNEKPTLLMTCERPTLFIPPDDIEAIQEWSVDLDALTARHRSGLVIRFPSDLTCGVHGEPINLEDWRQEQGLSFQELARTLPRFLRLAADAFRLAHKKGRP